MAGSTGYLYVLGILDTPMCWVYCIPLCAGFTGYLCVVGTLYSLCTRYTKCAMCSIYLRDCVLSILVSTPHIIIHIFYYITPHIGRPHTYLSVRNWKQAWRFPMFRTSNVFWELYFTGHTWKLNSSGKSNTARAPMAWIGTTNFSRSVIQITWWK